MDKFTNVKTGLTEKEIKQNKEKYGSNALSKIETTSFFRKLLETLGDPIIRILLIALGIKVVFLIQDFDWYETVGIVVAIFIASFISTISEYGSEQAFTKMQEEASKIKCRVRRNGKIEEITIEDITVGDIVLLSSGDKIPADGILLEGDITVDESSLNGETKEAYKEKVQNRNITERNKVFRGTVVYANEATMMVQEIGDKTLYGQLATELASESPESPLKIRLRELAKFISKIGYIGAFLVAFSYLFSVIFIQNQFHMNAVKETITNYPLMLGHILHAMTLCVTIIVVAVPEGLPMMITLVLSSNMKRMLKNNVLVRKLVGIETAGSLNILFTDKTGTLTKGKLEVSGFIDGDGNEYHSKYELQTKKELFQYVSLSCFYNNASSFDENGQAIGGNTTDRALLEFIGPISNTIEKKEVIPFDSKNKYSITTIHKGKDMKLIKGAPEKIIPKCRHYYNGIGMKCGFYDKRLIEQKINQMTNNGIRVIALAINDNYYIKDSFENITFIGLILIKDEIRKEAIEGLKLVSDAYIDTVMITGDNKNTAMSIGREIGLLKDEYDVVLTSDELAKMSDDDVKKILPNLKIVARALPQDKSRLVTLSQQLGLVVGMTGDGVNDAPALKKADVGFAMGSGTEVSKEASDIVILDDNFLSISKSILFGRTVFKSIRKFIILQLTINMCAMSLSIIGPFIGIDTPVTVVQMLWINMVMDTLAGLAFAFEPPLLEYMKEKPKKKNEPIMNKYMLNEICFTGIYSSILCFIFLKSPWIQQFYQFSVSPSDLMTAFFGLFIFIDIFNSLNARTERINILANIMQNKVFLGIMIFVVFVQLLLIYFGGSVFRTSGLTFVELQLMILLASTVIPVDWFRKWILKKKKCAIGV